jgi:hypothetical protein
MPVARWRGLEHCAERAIHRGTSDGNAVGELSCPATAFSASLRAAVNLPAREDCDAAVVRGERGQAVVNAPRTVQSRVSHALGAGLLVLLRLSALASDCARAIPGVPPHRDRPRLYVAVQAGVEASNRYGGAVICATGARWRVDDGQCATGNMVLLSAEDAAADTLRLI